MAERPHILSVSNDAALLKSRQMVLEAGGYRVTSVVGYSEALAAFQSATYDLLIIGHSLLLAEKQSLIESFRKSCPLLPILALTRPWEVAVDGANKSFDASYSPEALLVVVQELLGPR